MADELPPLVSHAWLRAHLHDRLLRLIDTRYYLDGKDPDEEYQACHISGAVYADMEQDLTGHPGWGGGRHPLPLREEFEQTARRLGINNDAHVVVYGNSFSAPRLWWTLRFFGFERVSVLDGGMRGWEGPVSSGLDESPSVGDFVATSEHPEWLATFDDVVGRAPDVALLDARGPDRFAGLVAPGDPYPGHIPGAISAHWEEVGIDDRAKFGSPEAIRNRLATRGVTRERTVYTYCGSGVQACHLIFSFVLSGLPQPRLYVGSWSDYARRVSPDQPADP